MNENATYLAALLRLWTLKKVEPAPSGSAAAAAAAAAGMSAVWLLLWIAIDWQEAKPDPQFFLDNVPLFAWYALAGLGLAALLRWQSTPSPGFAPMLALSAGLVPVPLLLAAAAPYLSDSWLLASALLAGLYALSYLVRGLRAFTGTSQRPAAVAGIVFVAAFIWLTNALDAIPEVFAPRDAEAAAHDDGPADTESILFEQAGRIDHALAAVGRDASPAPKAYFLGFAGVGEQRVFAQEIGLASRVLAERYGIDGRELSLINDQRDLDAAPLASVSGLEYALRGLADRMDRDRDVLFLSISSHGAKDPAIVVSNSQLPLNDLTEEALAAALAESGIKWRVIIISACYAGGFIDSLKDSRTIVITAAAADRTSFGCSNDSDLTYFGEAFYRDALPGARTLREAFDKAKAAIAERERREHVDESRPEAYFGAELEKKLASMRAPP